MENEIVSLPRGSKFEYVVLRREDRGIKNDPQYDGLLLDMAPFVVFYNTGENTLGAHFFKDRSRAKAWATEEGIKEAERENGGHIGEQRGQHG